MICYSAAETDSDLLITCNSVGKRDDPCVTPFLQRLQAEVLVEISAAERVSPFGMPFLGGLLSNLQLLGSQSCCIRRQKQATTWLWIHWHSVEDLQACIHRHAIYAAKLIYSLSITYPVHLNTSDCGYKATVNSLSQPSKYTQLQWNKPIQYVRQPLDHCNGIVFTAYSWFNKGRAFQAAYKIRATQATSWTVVEFILQFLPLTKRSLIQTARCCELFGWELQSISHRNCIILNYNVNGFQPNQTGRCCEK